jgi:hypothetical protein
MMHWKGNYYGKHVIVCQRHREDYKNELEDVEPYREGNVCFFCNQEYARHEGKPLDVLKEESW